MKKLKIYPEVTNAKDKVRTYLLLIVLCMVSQLDLRSQDNVFLKNGTEIKAKVIEISDHSIRYQKYDEQGGAIYTIPKTEVFMVKYENGIKEVFESQSRPAPAVIVVPATQPNAPSTFDSDTSDFAKMRRKKFSGPRVGLTVLTPGTSADYLNARNKRPMVTQFGWQFESRLFTVEETSGILEVVPMIGGLEQGLFIPSVNILLGIRMGHRFIFEFAIGPNFSVSADYYGNRKGFAGLVLAAGTSFRKGNVYFPLTIAFVPSVGNVANVYDPADGSTTKVEYNSGSRISLIIGFNSRKK